MNPEKLKKSDAGEVFLKSLPQRTREKLERLSAGPLAQPLPPEIIDDDDEAAGAAFLTTLNAKTRKALVAAQPAPSPEAEAEKSITRYCVVEAPDGEWAQLRSFKTPEGLARRLQQLEGTDTVVWCFYGIPLAVTKGPQRYLDLPGGQQKIQIPMFDGGPCKIFDTASISSPPVQTDGYIGPKEMTMTQPIEAGVAATGGDDDDEND